MLPNFVIMIDLANLLKCFLPKHTINIALFWRLALGSMCYTSLTILMISFFRFAMHDASNGAAFTFFSFL